MAWKATIKSVNENPVPNDSVEITIEFSDGTKTFEKVFNLSAGNLKNEQDLATLVATEISKLDDFTAAITAIKTSVGKEISKDGTIKAASK